MEGICFAGIAAVRQPWGQTKELVDVNVHCISALREAPTQESVPRLGSNVTVWDVLPAKRPVRFLLSRVQCLKALISTSFGNVLVKAHLVMKLNPHLQYPKLRTSSGVFLRGPR